MKQPTESNPLNQQRLQFKKSNDPPLNNDNLYTNNKFQSGAVE